MFTKVLPRLCHIIAKTVPVTHKIIFFIKHRLSPLGRKKTDTGILYIKIINRMNNRTEKLMYMYNKIHSKFFLNIFLWFLELSVELFGVNILYVYIYCNVCPVCFWIKISFTKDMDLATTPWLVMDVFERSRDGASLTIPRFP